MPQINKLFDPTAIKAEPAKQPPANPTASNAQAIGMEPTIAQGLGNAAASVGLQMQPDGNLVPAATGQNMQDMFDQSRKEQTDVLIQSNTPSGGVDFKALVARMALPAYLQQSMPEVADRELTGYIGFCSDASKHYQEQTAAGLKNGQIFLKHQGQYIGLDQLEFFIANGSSFRSVMESDGRFSFVTRDLELKTASISYNTGPGFN